MILRIMAIALFILNGSLLLLSSAYADCLTHRQARIIWPNKYLHWHGKYCWSYPTVDVPLPRERPAIDEWFYSDRWWLQ
jgi:hypothetical protein